MRAVATLLLWVQQTAALAPRPLDLRFDHVQIFADAVAPEAIDDFKTRVLAGRLDRGAAVAASALKSLKSARAAINLAANFGEAPDTKRLNAKLQAAAAARARLGRMLAEVDGSEAASEAALVRDGAVRARALVAKLQAEVDKGTEAEKDPTKKEEARQASAFKAAWQAES